MSQILPGAVSSMATPTVCNQSMARPQVCDQEFTRSGITDAFGHDEVVELLSAGFWTFAAGAQTARRHQNVAVAQLAVAFVDEQDFSALLRRAHRGGEAC